MKKYQCTFSIFSYRSLTLRKQNAGIQHLTAQNCCTRCLKVKVNTNNLFSKRCHIFYNKLYLFTKGLTVCNQEVIYIRTIYKHKRKSGHYKHRTQKPCSPLLTFNKSSVLQRQARDQCLPKSLQAGPKKKKKMFINSTFRYPKEQHKEGHQEMAQFEPGLIRQPLFHSL